MLRILGCALIFGGGAAAAALHARASLREVEILGALCHVLGCMESDIRLNQTPLPRLLMKLSLQSEGELRCFLQTVGKAAEGDRFTVSLWRRSCGQLPLGNYERGLMEELGDKLSGDEESLCRALSQTREQLLTAYDDHRCTRGEKERRNAAVCLSASAFVMILLL